LQNAFDKQLEIIKMLRDRIDEMTPDDIDKEKGKSKDSPFSLSIWFTPHTLAPHTPSYAHLRKH
jgi:hypothetical protein